MDEEDPVIIITSKNEVRPYNWTDSFRNEIDSWALQPNKPIPMFMTQRDYLDIAKWARE